MHKHWGNDPELILLVVFSLFVFKKMQTGPLKNVCKIILVVCVVKLDSQSRSGALVYIPG